MFRHSCVLILVLLALSLPSEGAKKKYADDKGASSLSEGTRKQGDTKIYHKTIKGKRNPAINGIKLADVCFPSKAERKARKFTITEYSIKDVDKGGMAFLKSGGVGKHKVCFHVKSRPEKSYRFDVEIWGTYNQ